MSTEDLIAMAREAGVYSGANEFVFAASLERFAKLIEARTREECARIFEAHPHTEYFGDDIASTIRDMGERT